MLKLLHLLGEAQLTRADAQALTAMLRCSDANVLLDVVNLLVTWLTPTGGGGALSAVGAAFIDRLNEQAHQSQVTIYNTLVDLMHGDSEVPRPPAPPPSRCRVPDS